MNSSLALSTGGSFSYDGIKLRPEEYNILTQSNSPIIEFAAEGGKTIVCRKDVDKMEKILQESADIGPAGGRFTGRTNNDGGVPLSSWPSRRPR